MTARLEWIKRTWRSWPFIVVMLIRDWAESYLDRHYLDD